jgi:LuxR family transcriptional regulator, maltose regulon positive regulatory protein
MMAHRTSSTAPRATAAVVAAQSARTEASDRAYQALRFASTPGVAQGLSPREISIVDLIGHGQSNKEIARQLGIMPETVKTHVKNIFLKLGVERRAQAVSRAYTLGLISGSPMAIGYAQF